MPRAVRGLSRSVRALSSYLEEAEGPDEARSFALEAARLATEVLSVRHDLPVSVLVGQVRAMSMDLLRSTSMDQAKALRSLEEAAGSASDAG
ncbi:MAG: hypothetical protein M3157_06265 [Actinomycetota bacterium]|nr:hypothetical protein [Actinomycetota bacterium]